MLKFIIAFLMTIFSTLSPASVTYTFEGPNYVDTLPGDIQGNYTTSMRITGNFTVNSPFQSNMPLTNVGNLVQSWTFSDGLQTLTENNSQLIPSQPDFFSISTDNNGNIQNFTIAFIAPKTPPSHTLTSRPSMLAISNDLSTRPITIYLAIDNAECNNVDGDDLCDSFMITDGASAVRNSPNVVGTWTKSIQTAVPTLSEWGMIIMSLLLALGGGIFIKRRNNMV